MQKFDQHAGLLLRALARLFSIAMVCFQITVSSTLADIPQQLVAKLQQEKMNADEMIACESALKASPAAKVLPLLLPLVSQGMPEGPIWNSGGVKIDINAPLDWRVFCSSSRVWNHLAKQNPKLAGELLADALAETESGREKKALLGRLSANWNDQAEPIAAEILRNWKKEPEAWMPAAYCLASRHRDKYDDLFSRVLTELPDKTWRERNTTADYIRLLTRHRIKALTALKFRDKTDRSAVPSMNQKILSVGFSLIDKEEKKRAGGGYFLALGMADYVEQDFAPDEKDPRFQKVKGKLPDAYFSETSKNALRWWKEN